MHNRNIGERPTTIVAGAGDTHDALRGAVSGGIGLCDREGGLATMAPRAQTRDTAPGDE